MENVDLTKGSIKSHIKKIAIPASIGYLFNTLYNVVDTFYAGKLSTDALAGMTISFPIFFIIIALSSGLGSGVTALNAIALGEKNKQKFHLLSYNGIILGLITSIIIIIIASPITAFLFRISGASGQSMIEGQNYTEVIFYGALFFILNAILNGVLNAQGDTKTYRNFLILGFFLNLFLDPLFIYGWFNIPKLGTRGVALATLIIQILGTFYLAKKVLSSAVFELNLFKKSKFSKASVGEIFKQGLPASLNMATIALGVFVINYFVLLHGNASTIAGYGAALRIEQLALLPALGLNIAVLTITGQNFGAKNIHNIQSVYWQSLKIGCVIMIIGAIIIYPFAPVLIKIFNSDPAVIDAGTVYLRIEVYAFLTYIFLNMAISSMQGFKKPTFAIYIGLYRQIFIPAILFYILGSILDLGIIGIWWGIVLVNWSAVIITLFYYHKQFLSLKDRIK